MGAVLFGNPEEHGAVLIPPRLDNADVTASAINRVYVGNGVFEYLNGHAVFGQNVSAVFLPKIAIKFFFSLTLQVDTFKVKAIHAAYGARTVQHVEAAFIVKKCEMISIWIFNRRGSSRHGGG